MKPDISLIDLQEMSSVFAAVCNMGKRQLICSINNTGVHLTAEAMCSLLQQSSQYHITTKSFDPAFAQYPVQIIVRIVDVPFFAIFTWHEIWKMQLFEYISNDPMLAAEFNAYLTVHAEELAHEIWEEANQRPIANSVADKEAS